MKFIPEAKSFYKLYSVWFMTALTIIPIIESQWSYFKNVIPESYHPWVFAFFGLAGVISRLLPQSNLNQD